MADFFKEFIFSFGAVYFFTFIFNAPKRTRLIAGLIGAVSYALFIVLKALDSPLLACYFISTLLIAFLSEFSAKILKAPSTVFISIAILALVPGIGLYRTMNLLTFGNYGSGTEVGIQTLLAIGSIAMALAVSLLILKLYYSIKAKLNKGVKGDKG